MTIPVRRLANVLPGLTLYERLDALLGAYQTGQPFDREILTALPLQEAERWNWMAGMLHATHTQLGWYVDYVEATVTQLELRQGILLALQFAGIAMEHHLYEILLDPTGDEKRATVLKKQETVESLSMALATRIGDELAGRWLDVRLADITADSLKVECVGRDLMHPEIRAKLDDCRRRLEALRESLKLWVEVEFEEPTNTQVERMLDLLERVAEE
ncbi:MAG: hypothetical protein ABI577_05415 [bacterium]